ncbi:Detected protein of confused Function [Hibiscus syriacus]|uniref:Detected protein of confused Function n=1 Tax=Hibiscus syriacus TaxID=106335 RepID=A0A6A2XDW8_HIBSY|nr:transmembrane protein 45A-like [Hibiscus syriacus]KAE8660326.1 Detected protein of confused Function [Hibiscus syriacus]
MGTLVGHVAPGFAFFALGLWHLFNHIKLHAINPNFYTSFPWFPTSKFRHLELVLIMLCSSISISMELFIGPAKHHPFDTDGTIPSNHLHNFEHSAISMTFFVYAAFAIILDTTNNIHSIAKYSLTQLLGGVAFAQQLFLFHLHSADHMGVEGQYHLLLQSAIVVCLATTLMGIGYPKSFLVSFTRSLSILYQGIWLMVMGYMLWTPGLIPKGCFIHFEEGHQVVRCSTDTALHRAKSLVNIGFSWTLIGVTIFAVSFYLVLVKFYGGKVEYSTLAHHEDEKFEVGGDGDESDDVELQKGQRKLHDESKSFIHLGKGFAGLDIER